MNESLVHQYATGKKFPSSEQAKKIEESIHKLAEELKLIEDIREYLKKNKRSGLPPEFYLKGIIKQING